MTTKLPEEFIARMRYLGEDYQKFLDSYEKPAERAIRVNTLKLTTEEFEKITPLALDGNVSWERSGYFICDEHPGRTVEHAAGLYYVQEPSAMSPVPALDIKPGERVLDLCSAPGGKGTQIAQYMKGDGVLVLNEINFARAGILSENVERLGVTNAVVTCAAPETLAEEFCGYFDKILVDAPCSGEGMFKKEENAVKEWSAANVAASAERQARILRCADKMLADGGRMVYSTCTFSSEEDEEQVEKFLAEHKSYSLIEMKKLLPHEVRGEGQFFAALQKSGGERRDMPLLKPNAPILPSKAYAEWAKDVIEVGFQRLCLAGGELYSLPQDMPKFRAQILRAGVRLGSTKGGRFEPSHSLAMCLGKDEAKSVSVDFETALNYLRGLTFNCSATENGWRLVTYLGYPLGWCKVSGGVAKNHLPKGLRI